MINSEIDHLAFFKNTHLWTKSFIFLVCVNDIIITSNDQECIKDLKNRLFSHIKTKDLRRLRYFRWIELAQSQEGITISHTRIVTPHFF